MLCGTIEANHFRYLYYCNAIFCLGICFYCNAICCLGICCHWHTSLCCRYFRKWANILCEFIPEIVFLLSIFGYMVILVITKWVMEFENSNCAPGILVGKFIKLSGVVTLRSVLLYRYTRSLLDMAFLQFYFCSTTATSGITQRFFSQNYLHFLRFCRFYIKMRVIAD